MIQLENSKIEDIERENELREQEEEEGEKRLRICGDEFAEESLLPIRTSPPFSSLLRFPSVAPALRLEKQKSSALKTTLF